MSNSNGLIINLAPTGMVPRKQDTPHVPLSASEVAADIRECVSLGASIVHIHARDADGHPSTDRGTWARLISAIREACPDVVITGTTSGRDTGEFEARARVLDLDDDLRPDMASLTLGSMNFIRQASENAPEMIRRLAGRMREVGVKPELEVFDLGMLNFAHHLIREDLLAPPYYFNLLLGNIATAQVRLAHIATMVADLPENSVFCLAGIGRFQRPAVELGLAMADGVRIGLEDNIWYDERREQLATNPALVQRAAKIADAMEKPLADAAEVRRRLDLRGTARPSAIAAV